MGQICYMTGYLDIPTNLLTTIIFIHWLPNQHQNLLNHWSSNGNDPSEAIKMGLEYAGHLNFGWWMLNIYLIRHYTVCHRKNYLSPNVNSDAVMWPFSRRHSILQLTALFPSMLSYWTSCLYPCVLLLFWIYCNKLISDSETMFSTLREQVNLLIHDFKCWLQVMLMLLIFIYYLYSYSVIPTS